MDGPERLVYRVGETDVDPAAGCLRRGGQDEYLRQQTFQVLLYLLEHRERLIGKEELRQAIWKDVAVGDDAMVQCVAELRRALGDDPRAPRFIKTVPKAGYRFIGSVEEIGRETAEVQPPAGVARQTAEGRAEPIPQTTAVLRYPRRRLLLTGVGLCLLVLAAAWLGGLGSWGWRSGPSAELALPQVPGQRRLAVMYFDNQSASRELDWLRQGLADMVITDLSRFDKLAVLGRPQLDVLLERVGLDGTRPVGLEQALDIGRRSQAQALVLGAFAAVGAKVRIEARVHDAQTGRLVGADVAVADSPDQILTQVDVLALKVAGRLGIVVEDDARRGRLVDVMTDNLEAYRDYTLGLEKSQALQSRDAIELFQKAVALDPQFAMAYARIGYTYTISLSYPDLAKPYLEKAFQLSSRLTDKDRASIAAWYAIASEDVNEAIARFRELIDRYPSEAEAYTRLGKLLTGENHLTEARDVLLRGSAVDPDNPHVYNNLGGVYLAMGKHDDAIAAYRRYVDLAPREANAHDSLGLSYQWAGRYPEAIAEFERAGTLDPNFEVAVVHLGNVYFQLGRHRQALKQYQRYDALADYPDERWRSALAIAWVRLDRGELAEAEAAIRRARTFEDRTSAEEVLLALARHDVARAEKLFANVTESRIARGSRGPIRAAEHLRGRMALARGQRDAAVAHFKTALGHQPLVFHIDSFEACLADAYLELGRLDEAIAEYERILRLNPNMPVARYHLAIAHERQGRPDRARAELERFVSLWRDADADAPRLVDARRRLALLTK